MPEAILPSIKVGLLNVNWTNGNREKPANPIPRKIIDQFTEIENHKINWLSETTGSITLEGEYNYLIFNEDQFYYLEKSGVKDVDKMVFVYSVVKDQWQTFINNPSNRIKGNLIKTNVEEILWPYIQKTKAPTVEVNSERVLYVTENAKCEICSFWDDINIQYFKKDEIGNITKFGYKWRINENNYKPFINKLNQSYNFDNKESNQIISYCKLTPELRWENYIAQIVENFIRKNKSKLTISAASNLDTLAPTLKTKIMSLYGGSVVYYLTIDSTEVESIVTGTKSPEKLLTELDLSQVDDIQLVDLENLEKGYTDKMFNKSVFDFDKTSYTSDLKVNNDKWFLKAKMYGKNINYDTFKHLPICDEIKEQNYNLNTQLLIEKNLYSETSIYDKHNLKFSNSFVPAFYYPFWSDSVKGPWIEQESKKYNTEIGFLLNNIADYYKSTIPNIPNKFVYNNTPIYTTIGIKLDFEYIKCDYVYKFDNTVDKNAIKNAKFSEVYKEQLNQSFWLTIWNSYLWWGELDRFFVGLSGNELGSEIKYTEAACYIDESENVWDAKKLSESEEESNQDKLPTYKINRVDISNQTEYKKALQIIQDRRKNLQILEEIYHPLNNGDIYWSPLTFGLFPYVNGKYSAKNELKINSPYLVVYTDKKYELMNKGRKFNSINSDFGFKLGLLNIYSHQLSTNNKENLIINPYKTCDICYIKPLLADLSESSTDASGFDRDANIKAIVECWEKYNSKRLTHHIRIREQGVTAGNLFGQHYLWDAGGWRVDYFDYKKDWPKNDDGTLTLVDEFKPYDDSSTTVLKTIGKGLLNPVSATNLNITIKYENGLKRLFAARNSDIAFVVNNYWMSFYNELKQLEKWNFKTYIDSKARDYINWNNVQDIKKDIDINPKGSHIEKLITELYKTVNEEEIRNNKYIHIDETTLKNNKPWVFSFNKGGKPYLFIFIKWTNGKKEPIIQIVLADQQIIETQPKKVLTLSPSVYLKNSDLVQVVNQQNFLYVHGQIFPIKTKFVVNNPPVKYKWTVDTFNISDTTAYHLRLRFEGEGGDFIKETFSVLKKEIKTTIGKHSQFELARLNVDLLETSEKRKFAIQDQKEKERITNLNIRNQIADLSWEQTWGVGINAASNAIALGTGVASAIKNPIAAVNLASTVTGAVSSFANQFHQHELTQRAITQQEISAAYNIEQDKNKLDSSHKAEEMREKIRIYELSNTSFTSIPNNANLIEAAEEIDTNSQKIVVFNRMPTGNLLEMLREYHKNFGFDIVVNDHSLSVLDIQKDNPQIYQYGRIDDISVNDLTTKEIIKNNLLNGVFLTNYTYKVKTISQAEQRKQYEAKTAALRALSKYQKEEAERKRLEGIKVAAKGVEEAKEEYKRMEKMYKEYKETHDKSIKEVNRLKTTLEQVQNKLSFYDSHIEEHKTNTLAEEKVKWDEEKSKEIEQVIARTREEDKKIKEDLNKELVELNGNLVKAQARVREEEKKITELNRQLTEQKEQVERLTKINEGCNTQINELTKQVETCEKLRKSYDTMVDAHKVQTAELEKCKTDLKHSQEHGKTPEEQAREYKTERELKLKGYVTRVCELIKLWDTTWVKLLNCLNDSYSYMFLNGAKIPGPVKVTTDKKYVYMNNRKEQLMRVRIKDIPDFYSIIVDNIPNNIEVYHHAYERSYFGFKLKTNDHYKVYSNTQVGRIYYHLGLMIGYMSEWQDLASKIDQFFTTDNAIAMEMYPELDLYTGPLFEDDNDIRKNNTTYRTAFRNFTFNVNLSPQSY